MATGGNFLYRQLEQMLPRVLEKRYRQLIFENGALIPTVVDLEPGAAEVVGEVINEVGNADIISDGAFDIPLVDLSASEDRYKVIMCASGFSYTFQQERAFETRKANLNDRKMLMARRAIAERMNRIGAYGDRRVNINGFLNQPGVQLNNSSFNPYTSTADQIADWVIGELESFHINSNSVEMASTAVIPTELYFEMVRTRMGDTSQTLLQYVQTALSGNGMEFEFVKAEEARSTRLEANGVQAAGTNKDRMVMYVRDPEVVERHIELPQLMPEEWQNIRDGRKVYPMFACTTPVMLNHQTGMRYIDFPKR